MSLPTIIAIGNLVADPELRFLPSGQAVAKLRIACSDRRKNKDTGVWEDGDTTYLSITCWRQLAENTANSFTKGMRVSVIGKLKSRTVEHPEHGKQTYYEVDAESVAADTANATVKVSKTVRMENSWGTVETSTVVDDGVPF